MPATNLKPSPEAAENLEEAINGGFCDLDLEDLSGETDCPEGCIVEMDGYCSHGYKSAALTLGII